MLFCCAALLVAPVAALLEPCPLLHLWNPANCLAILFHERSRACKPVGRSVNSLECVVCCISRCIFLFVSFVRCFFVELSLFMLATLFLCEAVALCVIVVVSFLLSTCISHSGCMSVACASSWARPYCCKSTFS